MAYSLLADQCRSDADLEELDIRIGMAADFEDEARAALRDYQEEMGMRFDHPDAPVAALHPEYADDEEFR